MGIQVGISQSHIASHRVAYEDALFHSCIVEDGFHGAGHHVHRVHLAETFGIAVTGEVDGDDMH
jgi:hypothetical protein